MRILPLNITLRAPLNCYNENVINILCSKLRKYKGNSIEILFREMIITNDTLKRIDELVLCLECYLGKRVKYELQITGEGLTKEVAKYLKEKNITVCLLVDGPEIIYEQNCRLMNWKNSHVKTIQAVELLEEYKVGYYIGVAVTSVFAENTQQIFSHFVENGWKAYAFWPVICEDNPNWSTVLSKEEYLTFIEELFLFWIERRSTEHPIYVREFENFAGSVKGYPPLISSMSGRCPFQNLFLPNGEIYSRGCGGSEYLCEEFKEQKFQCMESIKVDEKCKMCRWVSLCQSDRTCCMNSSLFCDIYQRFYLSELPVMFDVLRKLAR